MSTELLLVKDKGRLASAEPYSAELMDGIPQGTQVMATVRFPRHPQHHAKLFVILNEVVKATDKYFDADDLLKEIKIGIGFVDKKYMPNGTCRVRPKSISFADCSQPRFKQFYDKAMQYICTEILKDVKQEEFEQQILEKMI